MKSNKTAVFLQLYIKYGKQRSSKVKQAQKEAKYMNITFSKAFLMSGEDFKLTSSITLHHPTIKEILSISQSSSPDLIYWSYIQILLADPYLNMVMLDDMGKNYLETSPMRFFISNGITALQIMRKTKQNMTLTRFIQEIRSQMPFSSLWWKHIILKKDSIRMEVHASMTRPILPARLIRKSLNTFISG